MKKALYEVVFKVTATLQNGKEQTFKKTVYMPRVENGKHIPTEQRIIRGIEALKEEHYYNIEYVATHATFLTFA